MATNSSFGWNGKGERVHDSCLCSIHPVQSSAMASILAPIFFVAVLTFIRYLPSLLIHFLYILPELLLSILLFTLWIFVLYKISVVLNQSSLALCKRVREFIHGGPVYEWDKDEISRWTSTAWNYPVNQNDTKKGMIVVCPTYVTDEGIASAVWVRFHPTEGEAFFTPPTECARRWYAVHGRLEESTRLQVRLDSAPLCQDLEEEEKFFPGHSEYPSTINVVKKQLPANVPDRLSKRFARMRALGPPLKSASFWTKTPTLTSIPDHSDNGQPPRNILDEGLVMRKAPPSSRTATDGVDHVDGPVFVDDHQNATQLQYASVYELKPLEVHDGNELQTRLENGDALSTSQYKSLVSHTPPLPLPDTADTRSIIGDDKPAALIASLSASSPVLSTSTYLLDLFYDEHDLYCDDDPRNDESSDSMSIGSSMEEEETLNNSLDAQPITSDFEGVANGMGEDFPQPLYVVPEDVEMAEEAETPEDVEMPDRQEADLLLSLSALHLHDQEMEVDSALESFKIPSGLTSTLATDCVPMDLDPVEPRDVEMEIASFPAQATVISASGRPVKPFKPRLQGIHATMNQGSGLLGGMCTTSSEINEEIASTVSPSIPRFPALLKGRRTVNLRRSRK